MKRDLRNWTESEVAAHQARVHGEAPTLDAIGEKYGLTKPIPDESVEQRVLVRWLDMKGILFCHVPNGGKRNIGVAKKMKAEGVRAGVPDILIFDAPPNSPGKFGTAVELKRRKGGTVSPHQKDWLRWLNFRSWETKVCNGADDAIKWLTELGY